jgi:predicted ATPase
MEKTIVAQAINSQASQSGALFAKSEIDASQAMEIYARVLGTEPTYTAWIANRTDWVNGYVTEKPQAKGNSADQAFTRFARRLNESFGIVAPKAQTEASIKKATERAKKAEELAQKYESIPTHQLTDNLRQAYELQAKNPTKKMATLKELETILKARTKAEELEGKEELKTARNRLFQLAKACTDVARIEAASDVLDELNYDIEIS